MLCIEDLEGEEIAALDGWEGKGQCVRSMISKEAWCGFQNNVLLPQDAHVLIPSNREYIAFVAKRSLDVIKLRISG